MKRDWIPLLIMLLLSIFVAFLVYDYNSNGISKSAYKDFRKQIGYPLTLSIGTTGVANGHITIDGVETFVVSINAICYYDRMGLETCPQSLAKNTNFTLDTLSVRKPSQWNSSGLTSSYYSDGKLITFPWAWAAESYQKLYYDDIHNNGYGVGGTAIAHLSNFFGYHVDEPDGDAGTYWFGYGNSVTAHNWVRDNYNTYKSSDSSHVFITNIEGGYNNSVDGLKYWNDTGNVLSWDQYPYNTNRVPWGTSANLKYSMFGAEQQFYNVIARCPYSNGFNDATKSACDIDTLNKPIMEVIQANGVAEAPGLGLIPLDMIRGLAYQSIIFGTDGLNLWHYNNHPEWANYTGLISNDTRNNYVQNLGSELSSLGSIFLLPKTAYGWYGDYDDGTVSFSTNPLVTITDGTNVLSNRPSLIFRLMYKSSTNNYYLIVVNRNAVAVNNVNITISSLAGTGTKYATTLGLQTTGTNAAGRNRTVSNGVFLDSFDAYGANMYEIGSAAIPPTTYTISGYTNPGTVSITGNAGSTTSASNGYYSLSGLSNGTYSLTFTKTTYDTGYLNSIVVNGANRTNQNITLNSTGGGGGGGGNISDNWGNDTNHLYANEGDTYLEIADYADNCNDNTMLTWNNVGWSCYSGDFKNTVIGSTSRMSNTGIGNYSDAIIFAKIAETNTTGHYLSLELGVNSSRDTYFYQMSRRPGGSGIYIYYYNGSWVPLNASGVFTTTAGQYYYYAFKKYGSNLTAYASSTSYADALNNPIATAIDSNIVGGNAVQIASAQSNAGTVTIEDMYALKLFEGAIPTTGIYNATIEANGSQEVIGVTVNMFISEGYYQLWQNINGSTLNQIEGNISSNTHSFNFTNKSNNTDIQVKFFSSNYVSPRMVSIDVITQNATSAPYSNTGNITGIVYNNGTNPIQDSYIYLMYQNGSIINRTNSSSDGTFSFSGVATNFSDNVTPIMYRLYAKMPNESSNRTLNFSITTDSNTLMLENNSGFTNNISIRLINRIEKNTNEYFYINLSSFDFENDSMSCSTNSTAFTQSECSFNGSYASPGIYYPKFGASDSNGYYSNVTYEVNVSGSTPESAPTILSDWITQPPYERLQTIQMGIVTDQLTTSQNWSSGITPQTYENQVYGTFVPNTTGVFNISVNASNANGITPTFYWNITVNDTVAPLATDANVVSGLDWLNISWNDSTDDDLANVTIDIRENDTTIITESIGLGIQYYNTSSNLSLNSSTLYSISIYSTDTIGNYNVLETYGITSSLPVAAWTNDFDVYIDNVSIGSHITNSYYQGTYLNNTTHMISIRAHNNTFDTYSTWVNNSVTTSGNETIAEYIRKIQIIWLD